MNSGQRIALVTGAARGIGYYLCRDLARLGMKVILTARDAAKGKASAGKLRADGLDVVSMQLDVADPASVERAASAVERDYGRLDALINNAAVFVDHDWEAAGAEKPETLAEKAHKLDLALAVNLRGPYIVIEAFSPLMKKNRYGRIVNISSILGQLSSMSGGYQTYRITKAALNSVTRVFASELASSGILVNSVCPGWRRTDMGGQSAPLAPDEGNETIIKMATLPDGGPTGRFFRSGKEISF